MADAPSTAKRKKEVVIIGGGVAGCMTALQLAKNPDYHVTLLEAQDQILNGTSLLFSRVHLGGEYPLDLDTAKACLYGGVTMKWLLPDHIFSKAPPIRYLIGNNTQRFGENEESRLRKEADANQEFRGTRRKAKKVKKDDDTPKNGLTHARFWEMYQSLQRTYDSIIRDILDIFSVNRNSKLTPEEVEAGLYGSANDLLKVLSHSQYADCKNVYGGFQTQERGLNVPRFLATLQLGLEEEVKKGNITIRTNHKVKPSILGRGPDGRIKANKERGISGNFKNGFTVECENGENLKADLVVNAAWTGGPEITPLIYRSNKDIKVDVHRRAMMVIDLPEGWKTPGVFQLLGEHGDGGMLSPYNDKIALCYLPDKEAAYRLGSKELTSDHPAILPDEFPELTDAQKEAWSRQYYKLLQERFPLLKEHSYEQAKPRLILRDLMVPDKHLHMRKHQNVQEVRETRSLGMGGLIQGLNLRQEQQLSTTLLRTNDAIIEFKPGIFTVYPPKGTYALNTAIQASAMIDTRFALPDHALLVAPDMWELVKDGLYNDQYSLKNLQRPSDQYITDFCAKRQDLDPRMALDSWPELPLPSPWQGRFNPGGGGSRPVMSGGGRGV